MRRDGADERRERPTKRWTKATLAATRQGMFKPLESARNPNLFYTVPAQDFYVDIFHAIST